MKTRYFIVFFTAKNGIGRADSFGPNYINFEQFIIALENKGYINPMLTNIIELSKEDYLRFIHKDE